MTIDLKYPGVLLIISLFLVYFIVKFYLMKADLKTKNKFLFFSQKYVFFSLLLLLIFEPVLTKISYDERTEKRLLLFDNSRSVALNNPTDTILFKEIANGVLKDSSFLAYTFGDGIKRISDVKQLDFNDRFTKISTNEMNDLIKNSISKENIKSVIIFGDGNFNDADNFSLKNNLPVNIIYGSLKYSESDIFLSDLIYTDNPAGEEETRFSAVVGYNGRIKNGDFTLNIYEKGKIIKTVRQNIPDPDTFVTVKAELPKLSGDFREIEFSINPLSDEKNIFNNKKSAYQRKLSSTGNFLIIANSPSLDLSFFIKLLKSNGYNF
ncbi:MAG: hypothetical protein KKD38_09710, partial [Candidatus Delongbacteria bacterium]|nr:hypothetical protein [Candidatus Delongbacteria bacterium]